MLDEQAFVWSLLNRQEFMRQFHGNWLPQWFRDPALVPIAAAAFKFYDEHGIPPSIPTLHRLFQDQDATLYNLRQKPTLDALSGLSPDDAYLAYTLKKARDLAIVRSFEVLLSSAAVNESKQEVAGQKLLQTVSGWVEKFIYTKQEESLKIDEAIQLLFKGSEFDRVNKSIPSGLDVLDKWTSGGIRPTQLGIFLAPTGQGKSTILLNIAYKAALIEEVPTWFITNELSMTVQAERFLSRISGVSFEAIHRDPMAAYSPSQLDPFWKEHKLQERLLLTSMHSCTTQEIEASLTRRAMIEGWKPRLIVLDYMERVRPNHGHGGDGEWVSMQKVARDLIELAKRHEIGIWTAAQVNRAGMASEVELSLDMAQSSVRHLEEADYVIGLQKIKLPGQDEGIEAFKMKTLKNRHSRGSHKNHYLEVDLDRLLVKNTELAVADAPQEEAAPAPKRTPKKGLGRGKGFAR